MQQRTQNARIPTSFTFAVEGEHRPNSKNIPAEVHLVLFCIDYNERKHTVQHSRHGLRSKALVQMNDNFSVALSVKVKVVLISQSERVVNLPVVQQPDVRKDE